MQTLTINNSGKEFSGAIDITKFILSLGVIAIHNDPFGVES